MTKNQNNSYTNADIKLVSDIDHIRMRPGMYIGDTNHPYQLLNEALDNALDECINGYSDRIEVSYDSSEGRYSIRDYGRGIPIGLVDIPDAKPLESLEVLMTKSFSGGKFNNSNYNFKSGLHGLGNKCINALSSKCEVSTYRDNKSVTFTSELGVKTSLVYNAYEEPTGVDISFVADETIFDSIEIPHKILIDRIRTIKAFKIPIELKIDNQLVDLQVNDLSDLLETEDPYFKISIREEVDNKVIDTRLNYSAETAERFKGYTNLIYNKDGGTHTRLIRRSIMNVWEKFYPRDTILHREDCLLGLDCLVAVFLSETSFSSQTKDKLTVNNSELSDLMNKFEESFYSYLNDQPKMRNAMLERFEEYRKSKNKLSDQKSISDLIVIDTSIKSTKTVKRKSVVPGLLECTSKKVDNTELYLIEGRSASGGAARTRDRLTQSILPLRGKITNTTYMTSAEALNSEVILNIVNAVGCGIGDQLDTTTCRYEKIIILSDADCDGMHISALLSTLFINHMKELVLDGKVYILSPPLFGYYIKDKFHYTNEFKEIPDDIRRLKKYTRYKGLGEMDDSEFKVSCLTEGNRNLKRLSFPDDHKLLNEITGSSSGRRELLTKLNLLIKSDYTK